jgi:hypothetical protein
MTMTDDLLKERKEAGQEVERRMTAFLMEFTPARELKICDVQQIAGFARRVAVDVFSEVHWQ